MAIQTEINGLLYMRTRYYNPEVKRFINQDTVLGSITNSQSLNRYAYVFDKNFKKFFNIVFYSSSFLVKFNQIF